MTSHAGGFLPELPPVVELYGALCGSSSLHVLTNQEEVLVELVLFVWAHGVCGKRRWAKSA